MHVCLHLHVFPFHYKTSSVHLNRAKSSGVPPITVHKTAMNLEITHELQREYFPLKCYVMSLLLHLVSFEICVKQTLSILSPTVPGLTATPNVTRQ